VNTNDPETGQDPVILRFVARGQLLLRHPSQELTGRLHSIIDRDGGEIEWNDRLAPFRHEFLARK
jgi:hypothetical protein